MLGFHFFQRVTEVLGSIFTMKFKFLFSSVFFLRFLQLNCLCVLCRDRNPVSEPPSQYSGREKPHLIERNLEQDLAFKQKPSWVKEGPSVQDGQNKRDRVRQRKGERENERERNDKYTNVAHIIYLTYILYNTAYAGFYKKGKKHRKMLTVDTVCLRP